MSPCCELDVAHAVYQTSGLVLDDLEPGEYISTSAATYDGPDGTESWGEATVRLVIVAD